MLAFIYIPILQKEIDIFRETVWNNHRVRCQKDAQMPKGIPTDLFSFPERYDAEDCGKFLISLEHIKLTVKFVGKNSNLNIHFSNIIIKYSY